MPAADGQVRCDARIHRFLAHQRLSHPRASDLEALVERKIASGAIALSEVSELVVAAEVPVGTCGGLLDLEVDLIIQVAWHLDAASMGRLEQVCRRIQHGLIAGRPRLLDEALPLAVERYHGAAIVLPPRASAARALAWVEQVSRTAML